MAKKDQSVNSTVYTELFVFKTTGPQHKLALPLLLQH